MGNTFAVSLTNINFRPQVSYSYHDTTVTYSERVYAYFNSAIPRDTRADAPFQTTYDLTPARVNLYYLPGGIGDGSFISSDFTGRIERATGDGRVYNPNVGSYTGFLTGTYYDGTRTIANLRFYLRSWTANGQPPTVVGGVPVKYTDKFNFTVSSPTGPYTVISRDQTISLVLQTSSASNSGKVLTSLPVEAYSTVPGDLPASVAGLTLVTTVQM